MPPRLALGCLLGLALVAAGCGDGASPVDAEPTPKVTIVMTDRAYRPDKVRIELGTRITWVNAGTQPNTVETPNAGFYEVDRRELNARGVFDLHTLQPGEAESLVLTQLGEYGYGSSYDAKMWGVIEVVENDG